MCGCVFLWENKDECILDGCYVIESRSKHLRYLYDWDLCESFRFVFIIYHLKNLAESYIIIQRDFLCLSSNVHLWIHILNGNFQRIQWNLNIFFSFVWKISIVFFSCAFCCIRFKQFVFFSVIIFQWI